MSVCDHPDLISIESALTVLLADVAPLVDVETIDLLQADGRVLGDSIVSTMAHPPSDNSAMDGYAFRFNDLGAHEWFRVSGRVLAGETLTDELPAGCCVRIMTGASIPAGADTVVMQENTELNDAGWVRFTRSPATGDNVRRKGEELNEGDCILSRGRRLRPADLGLLASIGIAEVPVIRRLRVGLIATGDELCAPGQPLPDGHIYESNRYTLLAMLSRLGCDVLDMGLVADDMEALRNAFMEADQQCDLVVTTGGVSVGEADFCRTVLDELGSIDLWRLAIKPGKPFAFGTLPGSTYAGLPGNPVSAMVTFHQLVVPLIHAMRGENTTDNLVMSATLEKGIRKRPGRMEFQRGVVRSDEAGQLHVMPQARQGSALLTTMSHSNAYILLSRACGGAEEGERVPILLFDHAVN